MGQQKSILFVYPHADPFDPSGSGGQNRLYNLMQGIKKYHQISVVAPESVACVERPEYFSGYQQRTSGFISDLDLGLADVLQRKIKQNDPDVIHIPYPSGIVLSKFISAFTRRSPSVLLDAHDVMSERAIQFDNENLGFVADRVRRYYTPALEAVATRVADHIIIVSEKDRELMTRLNDVPPNKQTVVPNGAHAIDLDDLEDRGVIRENFELSSSDIGVVFHGNCETGTHNFEAAKYISQQLAPAFESDAEFFIIGKGAPQTDQENVTTLGFVDDLYSTLHAMDLAVVPLQSGTATKLKMFDYMSVQLPILSTRKGTEGIDLKDGKHVITRELDDGFETQLTRLIRDHDLREHLGNSGRRLIESKYNWKSIAEQLNEVYRNL